MMKNLAMFAALAAGANALIPRSNSCCFHVTTSGGVSGTIGQLGDGQNRVGGGLPEAEFCIDSNGGITDASGRGCIITPPTTQWQCDLGAQPATGFSIDSNGQISFEGDADFVACETGELDERNIYTTESSDVTNCKNVKLQADSCFGSGSGSSSAPSVPSSTGTQPSVSETSVPVSPPVEMTTTEVTFTPCSTETASVPAPVPGESNTPGGGSQGPGPSISAPSQPGTTTPQPQPQPSETSTTQPSEAPSTQSSGTATQSGGASCPTNLSGQYEFPHLIVPIDSASPDTAAGTSFNGTVSSTVSSIFNFDILSSDSGKTCSLIFLFPKQEQLETSAFTFSGDGKVKFESLESPASKSTTFNNAPAVDKDFGELTVSPGNSYLISTFECPAGQTVAYEMTNAGTTNLNYFQDFNPSPIGLYITVC